MPEAGNNPKSEPKKPSYVGFLSHMNATDFVNAGSLFKQPLVSAYFTPNLSTTMVNLKGVDTPIGNFTLSSGWLANWPEGKAYQAFPEHNRWLSSGTWEKQWHLNHGAQITGSMAGVLAVKEQSMPAGKTVSFLNPEFRWMRDSKVLGVGGIGGKNVTADQLYAILGYHGVQANIGLADHVPKDHQADLRLMTSYDWKLAAKHKIQFFTSLETGALGEQRVGMVYQGKANVPILVTTLKDVSLRTDVILNSRTAHGIENINARAEVPFNLSPEHKHALTGAFNLFAGYAGEFKSSTNLTPALNPVYGLGVKLNVKNWQR